MRVGDGGVEAQPKEVELGSRGILVQIQSMTEVGHSALSLQTVHQKLQDDAQGRDRVVELEDPESQDRHAPISYPRAMLKFQLSDGHHSVPAIEYHRIDGLSLAHTPLGSKVRIYIQLEPLSLSTHPTDLFHCVYIAIAQMHHRQTRLVTAHPGKYHYQRFSSG